MNTIPTMPGEAEAAALDQELKGLLAEVLGLDPAQAAAFVVAA